MLRVHILSDSGFGYDFIEYIVKYNKASTDIFYIYGIKNIEKWDLLKKKANIVILDNEISKEFLIDLKKCDKIILHSLFIPYIMLFIFIRKKYIRKSIPILWGGDLYEAFENFSSSRGIKKLLGYPREIIRRRIFKYILFIGCLTPEDYEYFKNKYKSNALYLPAIYSMQFTKKEYIELLLSNQSNEVKSEIKILVGNSANKSLKHMQVLDAFGNEENIDMWLPLSYGDIKYKESLMKHCHEKGYINIKYLTDYLSQSDYLKVFSQIDVMLINGFRQIALGNIYIAILLKKAVCLPKDSQNYRFLKNSLGIDLISYEELDMLNYTNLKDSLSKINYDKNELILKKYVSKENFDLMWEKILY